ncbi:MAG: hypothetical protein EOO88_31995, partial [Pedobacter sp.]
MPASLLSIHDWAGTAFTCALLQLLTMAAHGQTKPILSRKPPVEAGVSKQLAIHRKQTISQLAYALQFDIPPRKDQPIAATETISFDWKQNDQPIQLDFKEQRTQLRRIQVNQADIPIVF